MFPRIQACIPIFLFFLLPCQNFCQEKQGNSFPKLPSTFQPFHDSGLQFLSGRLSPLSGNALPVPVQLSPHSSEEPLQSQNFPDPFSQKYEFYDQEGKIVTEPIWKNSGFPGTGLYHETFSVLNSMIGEERKYDLAKAVFLVENAFSDGELSYESYCMDLEEMENELSTIPNEGGFAGDEHHIRNEVLFRYLTDTTAVTGHFRDFRRNPYTYDFDDFLGEDDWTKMFVTKLIITGSGQCHSLPLLYKILADELSIPSWLAFGPEHIFIRFLADDGSEFTNAELTSGQLVSDAWLMASGKIKAEAIRNRIYLDTLSRKQTLALCLADLAKGYTRKIGFDEFGLQIVERALEVHPQSIYAMQFKSDLLTIRFEQAWKDAGFPDPGQFSESFPQLREFLEERNRMYDQIDAVGYEPTPFSNEKP